MSGISDMNQNKFSLQDLKYFSFCSDNKLFDSLLDACYSADTTVLKIFDQNKVLLFEITNHFDLSLFTSWLAEPRGLIDNFIWSFFKGLPQQNVIEAYVVSDVIKNYLMYEDEESLQSLYALRKKVIALSQANFQIDFCKYYLLLLLKIDARLNSKKQNNNLFQIRNCGIIKYFILNDFKYHQFMIEMENRLLEILAQEMNQISIYAEKGIKQYEER